MKRRGRKGICIFCGSNKTISRGVRITITQGERRRRECLDCNRRFTVGRVLPDPPMRDLFEAQLLEPPRAEPRAYLSETPSLLPSALQAEEE
jgi:hypothetical protein